MQEDNPTLLLLLDVIPSFVIVLSAAVAGLSADIESEHPVWKARRNVFDVLVSVDACCLRSWKSASLCFSLALPGRKECHVLGLALRCCPACLQQGKFLELESWTA